MWDRIKEICFIKIAWQQPELAVRILWKNNTCKQHISAEVETETYVNF